MSAAPALNPSRPTRLLPAVQDGSERPRLGRPIPSALSPILLTPLVIFVHGYHPYAGDAGIYVAGVRHILDPSLYPINAVFPAAFTRLSLFPWMLAALVRLAHLRLSWVLLAAHLFSAFLFLSACRQLAARIFASEAATWCSVLLAAACFTLPVAGTALFVMDPCVTARSFSTPLNLMAVAACMDRAWIRTSFLLVLASMIHPLMIVYAIAFVVLLALVSSGRARFALLACCAAVAAAGAAFLLAHATPVLPAYREAVSLPQRTFLFLARWHGYEALGLFLPLLLFALALRSPGLACPLRRLCLTCLLLGTTSLLIAMLFVPPTGPYLLAPLQVLRSFHLIYGLGIVLGGGVFAALVHRARFAGISLLILLFAGMFFAQRLAWPGCNRIEWPRAGPSNPYQQVFLWIRGHTPRNAVFAFDPQLVYQPGEDEQGFRAIALRDHLADDKDAGIVAVLPRLADRWGLQRNAQFNVDRMTDAQRLATLAPLGANWLLLPPRAATQLPCPWRNGVVKVCRMVR